jgi:hypothetical protein
LDPVLEIGAVIVKRVVIVCVTVRISERVPVEVTELLAVFVAVWVELILELLEPVAEVEDVFDTVDEAVIVLVLYMLIEVTGLRDTVDLLVDVLLGRAERDIVVELEEVLEGWGDNVPEEERNDVNEGRVDILKVGDTELQAEFDI